MWTHSPERTSDRRTAAATLPIQDYRLLLALALAVSLALLLTAPLRAQEVERRTMELSLREAVSLALQRNFDIQIRGLDNESAYGNLIGANAVYDYTFFADFGFNRHAERSFSSFRGSETHYQDISMRLSRRLFTGADVSTSLYMRRSGSNSITSSINPMFNDTWSIGVSQPILRDFGKLATERQIIINSNNVDISEADFENQVVATLVDLMTRYWDLVSFYDALEVAEDALALAREQLEINRVKVNVGTLPPIEIVSAEERVASAEADLVDAQANLQRAEDRLKQAIVMEDWAVRIVPTDSLEEPEELDVDFGESLETALENRPEMRRLELQIDNNEVSISYARNQLLPSLNLTADVALFSFGGNFIPNPLFAPEPPPGLPLSFVSTLRDVFDGTNHDWTIGANFTYIFGNSTARSSMMVNQVQRRQNALRIEQTRYDIAVEVRSAIRELEISITQLEARRRALTYAERQLEAEQRKFAVGSSTNFQVLEYQNRLATARYNVILALARYQRALVDYDRATGTMLDSNNVVIETRSEGGVGALVRH